MKKEFIHLQSVRYGYDIKKRRVLTHHILINSTGIAIMTISILKLYACSFI